MSVKSTEAMSETSKLESFQTFPAKKFLKVSPPKKAFLERSFKFDTPERPRRKPFILI